MSAFNDYCIICEELIQSAASGQDKLYCSEACRSRDARIYVEAQEPSGTGALLRAPALGAEDQPRAELEEDDCDEEDHESYFSDVEMERYTTSLSSLSTEHAGATKSVPWEWTPRTFGQDTAKPARDVQLTDHTAEDNYQLWLSCKMRG
ncbi:AFR470Cp [Eremothecium gossypii ATCC 10895]|uniref:AFR470Cp n=1 Tax=Eremothecium gossypii (strain ATCC 10895 / CBS 109.51 / FGSC 9923 / NRRL Y-1056) TaxID=284811 RepID=Q752V3_EREGS|nr:AFR470Cp [Eremothecium gossypii ATCC 10895]AAS53841.1 AFR470Cp [Eremothecium gossypii ATCC 10895]AEY98154.1 FAFR470Cp [Eremothecium gossypii FDAG1]